MENQRVRIGTVLEPRWSEEVEHVVVVGKFKENGQRMYEVVTVKSKHKYYASKEELLLLYNVVGQSKVGKVLFG